MAKYLVRVFDYKIRTNYIERVIEADDSLDALEQMKYDEDVLRESKGKLSTQDSLSRIIDEGSFELKEI